MAAILQLVPIPEQNPFRSSLALFLVHRAAMHHPEPAPVACFGCVRAKAYRLPIHGEFLDGRSALDWQQSITAYLRWRAGLSWRPARHSGRCVADCYRDALHLVTQAFYAVPQNITHNEATPSACPSGRKPPRGVQAVAPRVSAKRATGVRENANPVPLPAVSAVAVVPAEVSA